MTTSMYTVITAAKSSDVLTAKGSACILLPLTRQLTLLSKLHQWAKHPGIAVTWPTNDRRQLRWLCVSSRKRQRGIDPCICIKSLVKRLNVCWWLHKISYRYCACCVCCWYGRLLVSFIQFFKLSSKLIQFKTELGFWTALNYSKIGLSDSVWKFISCFFLEIFCFRWRHWLIMDEINEIKFGFNCESEFESTLLWCEQAFMASGAGQIRFLWTVSEVPLAGSAGSAPPLTSPKNCHNGHSSHVIGTNWDYRVLPVSEHLTVE